MTPEEFSYKMSDIELLHYDSPEESHLLMDLLMCDLLESLGYGNGVAIFKESCRWYS